MEEVDNELRASWHLKRHTERLSIDPDKRMIFTGIPVRLSYKNQVTPLVSASGDSFTVWDGSSDVDYLSTKTEGRAEDYWFDTTKGYLYLKSQVYKATDQALNISYRYNYGGRTALNDTDGIDASDTTITVDSTAGFPEQGWFRIDDEEIRYNSKTSTTFTSIERGAYNTTAATHSDNAVVFWCPKDIEEATTILTAIELLQSEDWSVAGTISGDIGGAQIPVSEKISQWRKTLEKIYKRYRTGYIHVA